MRVSPHTRPRLGTLTSLGTGHILRVLATYHWVREVSPDVFANNRLTSFIDSGKSIEQLKSE